MKVNTKAFRQLQAYWYAKLAAETDYRDIENIVNGKKIIRGARKEATELRQAKETYFHTLSEVLNQEPPPLWENPNDETIMRCHSQGMKYVAIAERIGYNRITVGRIVARYVRRWGIVND